MALFNNISVMCFNNISVMLSRLSERERKKRFVCLFGLYIPYNNLSDISQRCLDVAELNAHFKGTASLKYHAPDT